MRHGVRAWLTAASTTAIDTIASRSSYALEDVDATASPSRFVVFAERPDASVGSAEEPVVGSTDTATEPVDNRDAMAPPRPDDHGPDIAALLTFEHDLIRHELSIALATRNAIEKRRAFRSVARALVRHDSVEQLVLYPVIAHLAGGIELRAEALREEKVLAATLARLLRRLAWRPHGRRTRRRLEEFRRVLEHHFHFEEREVLPRLASAEEAPKRYMMGTWSQLAPRIAATRPHPHGPQRLPGLVTLGVVLALVDRMRDRVQRSAR